ncbi:MULTISPECIES: DUF2642 domain-containing protein [Virgibacillus]|uniref:DUF2642 domain-containing protein n=1 Tax=Virgibacillus kapii TaxID=1638645 RepID=A0ABQ2DUU5_9BACI|nr:MULTISPECIES: DUF2642 domain-containing protein [Virgibacillus]EQB38985.1 hypothetical protein M948_01155 [Virgibacillus sp. CM-4]GGJ67969.1 hypothetical protein GCM10007111_32280 [Virgibacillus kapii]
MALTNGQRSLLELLNQLSQNLANSSGINSDVSLNLPGIGVDVGLDLGGTGSTGDTGDNGGTPDTPTTIRDVLLGLVNEQVELTTPFGMVTGTLLAVRDDYVVVIENTGSQALVRIDKIEFVSEL